MHTYAWVIDDDVVVKHGGTLDVRTLSAGIHQVSVQVRDALGKQRIEIVGTYDSRTGLLVSPPPL
jgi:hypothetical protein